MTDARITSQEIFLTPLSPLHIGCGEDYEPTNYVIHQNVLYSFDPAVVPLDAALRKELLAAVRSGSIPSVVKFFQRNVDTFRVFAENALPVCGQCVKTHRLMAEKGEGRNQNKIARTTYCATNEGNAYYLPGSALKGVIHTALLNRVNAGTPRDIKDDLDKKILGGTFSDSPMRFLRWRTCCRQSPYPRASSWLAAATRETVRLSIVRAAFPLLLKFSSGAPCAPSEDPSASRRRTPSNAPPTSTAPPKKSSGNSTPITLRF